MDTARYFTRQTQKNSLIHQNENMDIKQQQQQNQQQLQVGKLIQHETSKSLACIMNNNIKLNGNRNALGDVGNKIQSQQQQQQLGGIIKKETTTKITTSTTSTTNALIKSKQLAKTDFILLQNTSTNERMDISEDDVQLVEEVHMKSTHVIDIDENDHDNPQLVSCYVKDIYKYLMSLEKRFRIKSNFMESKICTTRMRAVLVDWLIQVHLKFHLLQETMYLCVNILDLYLQIENVQKSHLQLLGVTALFLAAKYEEMYIPSIEDFVYMTDNTYTKSDIRRMEIQILKTLNFIIAKPISLNFLRRFSKAGQADPKQHTLSKYFLELCLHDAEFSSMDPSYQAACALFLTFKLLDGSDWNDTLEYYSTYSELQLQPGVQKFAKLVLKSQEPEYKYKAVSNKYGSSKYLRISLLPELRGSIIRQLAEIETPSYS